MVSNVWTQTIHCTPLQIAAANHLQEKVKKTVEGRAKLGIDAFAQALLGIPKTLAENSGYDAQETVIKLQVGSLACTPAASWMFQCPSATDSDTIADRPSDHQCRCHTNDICSCTSVPGLVQSSSVHADNDSPDANYTRCVPACTGVVVILQRAN